MAGKLYGIGAGPGDPELLTLKALRAIKECDVVAFPGEWPKETVAYRIVEGICPEIKDKELLGISMPMTKDEAVLRRSHREGIERICGELSRGRDVGFLTLGDPTIYSTYMYLHKGVQKKGYPVEIISGVPSFCAAAAKLNMSLAEGGGQLHVIPASYQIDEALTFPGTKILMKAGRKLPKVKERLMERAGSGNKGQACMVENCGMEGEQVYYGAGQMPETAGYYTLVIVKDEEQI